MEAQTFAREPPH